jgi:hypothetical protein
MNWQYGAGRSNQKTQDELQHLVDDVIQAPDFDRAHLVGFNAAHESQVLDRAHGSGAHLLPSTVINAGWRDIAVDILVPDGQVHASEVDCPKFTIPGLYMRDLLSVIKEAVANPSSRDFHWFPFKHFWKSGSNGEPICIFGEAFTSDAFLDAHEEIQGLPREPGCTYERVVLALMFWSDSTHLTSFGDASLWPVYLYFGNLSKWTRSRPSTHSCHHVAYMPSVCTYCNERGLN